jgi:PPOX class probable F420-dependent enzyme
VGMAFESLSKPRFASLTTWRRNGVAVATPVWVVVSQDKAYVVSRGPGKVKRIRNNPAVSLAPCTMRGRVRGVEIGGAARMVGGELPEHVRRGLRRKYGPLPAISRSMARLFRQNVVLLEIDPESAAQPTHEPAVETAVRGRTRRDRPLVARSRTHLLHGDADSG